jgi:putative ABC transport system permease protein
MGWVRRFLTRRTSDPDLAEEIRQHLLEKTEALMSGGTAREEAEYAAKRGFGNVASIQERSREAWIWPIVENVWADTKFAVRQLRKNYIFTLSATLTLGLGIGATTAIFSLVNAVVMQPLPFPEPERLMWLSQQDHSLPGVMPEALSYPDYFDWRGQNHTFSGMASYVSGTATLESGGEAQRLDVMTVSANFFRVLGTAPMLGEDFRPGSEQSGERAVMLSRSLWRSAFGSATDIAGKTIRLGDRDYVVAGVMPKDFGFPLGNPAPALWVSLGDDADGKNPKTSQRGFDCLEVIGRLKPGVTIKQAKADLSVIAANLARQYPDNNKPYTSALVEPELQHLTGDSKPALRVLFVAVTMVLFIACANVASLLLARGSRRAAEFALRASIGASRATIIRQLLVESLVLSLCGGSAGVALAFGLLRGMAAWAPLNLPRMENAAIDGTVLVFVVVVSVVTGLLFGALPAWRMSELEPSQALRDGSRAVAGGRGQQRVQSALVIVQTAIGLVLLVSSGLFIRSFVSILNVDPGFDPKHVLTARLGVSFDKLQHDQHVQFYNDLLARLSAFPGVESVSAGWPLPMSDGHATVSFSIEGRPVAKGDRPSEGIAVTMPGYFKAMRIPLLSGRAFAERDGKAGSPVMMINRAFARKYFRGENPLGKRIEVAVGDGVFDHPVREIVGVVGDIKSRALTTAAEPQYYLPYAQAVITNPYVIIRTNADSKMLTVAVHAAIRAMDKSVPLYEVSALEDYVTKSAAQPRFQMLLLTCFAGIALLLAAIGLYGLLSYMVTQRALEIGLRMALGAGRGDVLYMIVRRGLTLALIGLGAGLVIATLLTRVLAGMLYGVQASDPVTFAAMSGVLFLVSLAASSIPAYRAARMDPMDTLRGQ